MGYTASMGMRDENGNPFFRPNQELTMGPRAFTEGAELAAIDDRGRRKVIAVYDEKAHKFQMVNGLSESDQKAFSAMEARQAEHMAEVDRTATPAKS